MNVAAAKKREIAIKVSRTTKFSALLAYCTFPCTKMHVYARKAENVAVYRLYSQALRENEVLRMYNGVSKKGK